MHNHILSIILFTPLAGALLLIFVPKENKDAIRWIANIFALAGLLVSIPLVPWFWAQRFEPGFKFMEGTPNNWIPSIGAGYVLGIDGISFLLIMLTTLLGWISILSSWTAIETRVKEYYIWFLVLQTGMLGVFMALDFFLFFMFWEAMLVPMYLLIGIWGGPRKLYAAIKFFLYTLIGSVLMLLSVLFLYFYNFHQTGAVHVQHSGPVQDGAAHLPRSRVRIDLRHPALSGILPGLRHQSADVPVPYLAARRSRGSAHRRLGHPGRRSAEDGNVRLRPLRAAILPGRSDASQSTRLDDRAFDHRHHLRRAGFPDAEGHEETGGVLVGQPPGFLHSGNLRVESRWD